MSINSTIELAEAIPASAITTPAEHLSARYAHITTTEIVQPLLASGWYIDSYLVKKSGDAAHAGHGLRLARREDDGRSGERPQIVVRNGSNGDTSLQMSAGIYRAACANRLVVGADMFNVRIAHRGANLQARAVAAMEQIVARLPELDDTVRRWQGIQMERDRRIEFAQRAAALRWDLGVDLSVNTDDLLKIRRSEDIAPDLWTVFNRVQESVVRGGVRVTKRVNQEPIWSIGPRFTTETRRARPVNQIEANLTLNSRLWNLAAEYSTN